MAPFKAKSNSTVSITVSASSASVALGETWPHTTFRQVRVYNGTDGTVWIDFGKSDVTADTALDIPLPRGAIEVYSVADIAGGIYAAAITDTATGVVYFTPGSGE
jgi:hypothetical protein